MLELSGQYVKEEFYTVSDKKPKYPADVQIVINLKDNNRLFKSEKYDILILTVGVRINLFYIILWIVGL